MNIVVCNHYNNSGRFLFMIPDGVRLDAGTPVTVETRNGIQQAVCITPSFEADPTVVCPLWNTTPENMKRVLSYLNQTYLEWPVEDNSKPRTKPLVIDGEDWEESVRETSV